MKVDNKKKQRITRIEGQVSDENLIKTKDLIYKVMIFMITQHVVKQLTPLEDFFIIISNSSFIF